MRLLHDLAKTHVLFDDPNLVSRAGLVPLGRVRGRDAAPLGQGESTTCEPDQRHSQQVRGQGRDQKREGKSCGNAGQRPRAYAPVQGAHQHDNRKQGRPARGTQARRTSIKARAHPSEQPGGSR